MFAVRFLLLLICLSLSPLFSISVTDSEALLAVKYALSNTQSLDSWKPDSDPCKDNWAGVFCLDGKNMIIHIHLPGMGLSGTIDVNALSQIRSLKTVSLINNSFTGPLPPFNKITGLKALYLRIWISFNKFSGKIPRSLGKVPNLQQLHLDNNEFSGLIPDISQKSLTDLNFSNNKLEGEIPASMLRFGATAFKGNADVCGKLTGMDCQTSKSTTEAESATTDKIGSTNDTTNSTKDTKGGSDSKTTIAVMVGIAVVMMVLLCLTMARKSRRKDDDFSMLEKEHMDDMVEVHVHGHGAAADNGGGFSNSRRSVESIHRKKEENNSWKGSLSGKGKMDDLVVLNNEKGVFGWDDLMKAAAMVLGKGELGSAYKVVMVNGLSVVVKKIRDMNKLGKEEFDAALRRIGKVRHPNILTPLAYRYCAEEKLMVSEYIPKGSLMHVLHGDRGICHKELNWPTRLKIIKGIASGMLHLHHEFKYYELPHGNLKSSNILLNDKYEPLLTDYGLLPLLSHNQPAKVMLALRAPEAAVEESQQQISPKCDVYCLGIVIIEILTCKYPSQYVIRGEGGLDVVHWVRTVIEEKIEVEFLDPEIASCTESIDEMLHLLNVGAACTETNPHQRPSMEEAVKRIEEIRV
ncbi:hypothetical protein Nepgr_018438 [Nepenthes gracilis]|uniref:Protein kinase domain-containing protein n=1 Tax=Nepenthes gracilis TaxID=150966 RepID=A0AAD3ST21_NEPGR|nr:hypothetical protein Nepgr_018438 [Nepenthes gracilis]